MKVHEQYDASYTLAEYLREQAGLKGTKVMCREGGCGACVVTATYYDLVERKECTHAINSVSNFKIDLNQVIKTKDYFSHRIVLFSITTKFI